METWIQKGWNLKIPSNVYLIVFMKLISTLPNLKIFEKSEQKRHNSKVFSRSAVQAVITILFLDSPLGHFSEIKFV